MSFDCETHQYSSDSDSCPFCSDLPEVWVHQMALSGSHTVRREGSRLFFYVTQVAEDVEGDHGRHQVCKELVYWLQYGEEPWWLEFLRRENYRAWRTPHGSLIQATGPMIDRSPPALDWVEDPSEDAQIDRGRMADLLKK